jgi:FhuF-like iron-sulfur protein
MRRRPGVAAAAALAAAAAAGPFFAVDQWSGGEQWRPLSALVTDRAVLSERVEHARGVMARGAGVAPAGLEVRAVASIVFLGLASRLVSPSLGAAVVGGVVPELSMADLWWRPVDSGPWPLAARLTPGTPGAPGTPGTAVGGLASGEQLAAAARLLSEGCVQGLAGPVAAAFGTTFRLSRQVLWGNVASALAGAAGLLAEAFPSRAQAAGRLTAQILGQGPLAGTGELVQPDAAVPRRFLVRRSCCLFYRVPGAGICGDCVLVPDVVRHQQWQAVLGRSALSR